MNVLPQSFYNRNTLRVAQDLLGCFLVRSVWQPRVKGRKQKAYGQKLIFSSGLINKKIGGDWIKLRSKIMEVEAYVGPDDLASHASRGLTQRNKVMFGQPGIIYVYFTYGMHYMLNIVTERKDYPAAVLIRAVEPISHNVERITCLALPRRQAGGRRAHNTNGPAKLTKALKIDKFFNGLPIYTKKYGLWVENRDENLEKTQIVKTTRVGVDYARKYKDKKWRFYLKTSKFVSRK